MNKQAPNHAALPVATAVRAKARTKARWLLARAAVLCSLRWSFSLFFPLFLPFSLFFYLYGVCATLRKQVSGKVGQCEGKGRGGEGWEKGNSESEGWGGERVEVQTRHSACRALRGVSRTLHCDLINNWTPFKFNSKQQKHKLYCCSVVEKYQNYVMLCCSASYLKHTQPICIISDNISSK